MAEENKRKVKIEVKSSPKPEANEAKVEDLEVPKVETEQISGEQQIPTQEASTETPAPAPMPSQQPAPQSAEEKPEKEKAEEKPKEEIPEKPKEPSVEKPGEQGKEESPEKKEKKETKPREGEKPGEKPAEEEKKIEKPETAKEPDHTVTPSESDTNLRNKPNQLKKPGKDTKEKAEKAAGAGKKTKRSKDLGKAAKELAKKFAEAIVKWGSKVFAGITWPYLLAGAIIALVVGILCLIVIAYFAKGAGGGKSQPDPAGLPSENTAVQKLLDYAELPNGVAGFDRMVFKVTRDKEFVEKDGKIDQRLTDSLNYLISKHKYIRVSHIISEYEYMNVYEAGTDTNPNVIPNITAHQDGLAADIDEIDYVYKIFRENEDCSVETAGLAGDIYYYNDQNKELLKLKCMGQLWNTTASNTTWNGEPAQAIPIKILYQDCKPDIKHAGNATDPCKAIANPTQQLVYDQVLQP